MKKSTKFFMYAALGPFLGWVFDGQVPKDDSLLDFGGMAFFLSWSIAWAIAGVAQITEEGKSK